MILPKVAGADTSTGGGAKLGWFGRFVKVASNRRCIPSRSWNVFDIPPENLTTQGYGEQYLKVQTQEASRENRRVTLRRITPLLTGQSR